MLNILDINSYKLSQNIFTIPFPSLQVKRSCIVITKTEFTNCFTDCRMTEDLIKIAGDVNKY